MGSAYAQDPATEPVPVPVPTPAPEPELTPAPMPSPEPSYAAPAASPGFFGQPKIYSVIGMGLLVGGSVNSYFGTAAMDASGVGAGWTARLELGTRSHIGGEFSYVGTTNKITTLGVDPNGQLLSNGAQGLLRLNVLTGPLQPYVGVGVGLARYQVVNTAVNTSDIANREDLPSVPGTVGISLRGMGLIVDTRFSVNAPISATMIPGSAMTSWQWGANIGAEF
jgi:hypothetical protein